MKVLVTGANGMVAKATIEHCRALGDEVVAKNRQEFDISDANAVLGFLAEEGFDAVLNCAAYTNVDGAEENAGQCFAANSTGVENLALASKETGSAFVTISTDYVFDGTKGSAYDQRDTPLPLSVYAKSKLEGEIRARNAYARSIIVRAGWIFGSDGTNFLSVMHKLLGEGKKIKAITDSYGTPTFAVDLARRMRELAMLDLPATYHVTNEGLGTTFYEFALRVCAIKGYDKSLVEGVLMDTLSRPAARPRDSRMTCVFSKRFGLPPIQSWEEALVEFLSREQ